MVESTESVKAALMLVQDKISQAFADQSQDSFKETFWQKSGTLAGEGRTRVAEGLVFEKAGVNFSHVTGESLPPSASKRHPMLAGASFEALGVSVVVHPSNPYVPTSHANIRFFQAQPKQAGLAPLWWFGGGFDLTPYYVFESDCILWHEQAKKACAPYGDNVYPQFKAACDAYFYLPHRQETRGIGGLFFDDLNEEAGWSFSQAFDFVLSVAEAYSAAYLQIVSNRQNTPYGERERAFQCFRRGRYVEFNLLYDRGTLFGLQSGGRTESILMSLPKAVSWPYEYPLEPGSKEANLTEKYLVARDWLVLDEKTVLT